MEKDNMSLRVDSFSCYLDTAQEKPQPSSPPPFTSITFSKSQDGLANLHLDSLSSYLNSTGASVEDPNSAFTFSRELGEIGVFNADRYFNMKLDYKPEPKIKYEEEVPPRPKPKTPSSCFSENSSSCNSQKALIPDNNLRKIGPRKHNKRAIGRKIFMGFGCRGPCFDKKSVSDISSEIKIRTPPDESRPSIEVFGSSNRMKADIAKKLERKLSMLTWDAIPNEKTVVPTPPSTITCDDIASEASSDLFEIENIANFQPGDDASTCVSPSSYYAPSEASIQWSVVTASGFSVLSQFNNETSVNVDRNAKAKVEGVQKTRASGILGCKNQRAVDVMCQKSSLDNQIQGKSRSREKDVDSHSYPSIL